MLEKLKNRLSAIPKWRLYLYAGLTVLVIVYFAWLKFHKPDIKPGQVITAPPAKAVKNEPVEAVKPKQIIVYRDTVRVVEKLGLPPAAPQEKVIQAVEVPRTKYGGTATTFVNMTTGVSRTEIKANAAPWFAFRNDLAIGAGAGIGTEGKTLAGRIRYDMVQIKNLTISPEIEANYSENKTRPVEGRAMIWMEWRR